MGQHTTPSSIICTLLLSPSSSPSPLQVPIPSNQVSGRQGRNKKRGEEQCVSGSGADASDSQVNPTLSKSGDAEDDEKEDVETGKKPPVRDVSTGCDANLACHLVTPGHRHLGTESLARPFPSHPHRSRAFRF